MLHAFKTHDGKVAVASSMEIKAKDISCSGWEVRRELCRDICSREMDG